MRKAKYVVKIVFKSGATLQTEATSWAGAKELVGEFNLKKSGSDVDDPWIYRWLGEPKGSPCLLDSREVAALFIEDMPRENPAQSNF